jgi:hypothetical protein
MNTACHKFVIQVCGLLVCIDLNCLDLNLSSILTLGWPLVQLRLPSWALTGFGKYLHLLVLWSDLLRGDVGGTQVIKKVSSFCG